MTALFRSALTGDSTANFSACVLMTNLEWFARVASVAEDLAKLVPLMRALDKTMAWLQLVQCGTGRVPKF
jgi:hypothetical protein